MNKIADVVNSIENDLLKSETRSKIKSLVDEFQAKITDTVIRKEGGLVVKNDFDTELKIKKHNMKMSNDNNKYFPPYKSSRGDIKVELDLSSYATKTDSKNVTHVDVSSLASKTNLASLKTKIDKFDIPKLFTVPVDLSKLTNKVANDVVEETDFNALEKKSNRQQNRTR